MEIIITNLYLESIDSLARNNNNPRNNSSNNSNKGAKDNNNNKYHPSRKPYKKIKKARGF